MEEIIIIDVLYESAFSKESRFQYSTYFTNHDQEIDDIYKYLDVQEKWDINSTKPIHRLNGCNVQVQLIKNVLKKKVVNNKHKDYDIFFNSNRIESNLFEISKTFYIGTKKDVFSKLISQGFRDTSIEENNKIESNDYTKVYVKTHNLAIRAEKYLNLDKVPLMMNKLLLKSKELYEILERNNYKIKVYNQNNIIEEITKDNLKLTKETRQSVELMLRSNDKENIEMAMDIIANSNIKESFEELIILFYRNSNAKVNYKNRIFKTIVNYFDIEKINEMTLEKAIEVTSDRKHLTSKSITYITNEMIGVTFSDKDLQEDKQEDTTINDYNELNF